MIGFLLFFHTTLVLYYNLGESSSYVKDEYELMSLII